MSQSSQLLICTVLALSLGAGFAILLIHYSRKLSRLKSLETELERLRSFSGGLPDLVVIIDENLLVVDIIAHKDSIRFHPHTEAIGKSLVDFLPMETANIIQRSVQQTIATQSIQVAEYSLPFPDGTRWFEGRSLLLPTNPSQKARVLWVPRDITDRRLVEHVVAESEARFRSIFQHSPVGIMTADTTGLVTDLNDAYLRIIGNPDLRDDIVGKHNLLDNPVFKQAGIQHLFQAVYDTQQSVVVEPEVTTLTGRKIMVRYHAAPQLSQSGVFMGCILICEDITDRVQAETSLRDSERRYRTLSELISDFACSFRVDENRRATTEWVTASFERMTSYTAEEVFSQGAWRQLVDPADFELVDTLFQSLVTKPTNITNTVRIRTKSGALRSIQLTFRSIWDDKQERITQMVGAGTDITEQIQVEAKDRELAANRQQVELLGNFIRKMSHHFRNPLSVVNTEVALMQSLQIHHIEPHLQKIERQVSHINHIIGKLSTLARLDHDPDFEFEVRDINFVLLELEVSLLHVAAQRNVTINFQMANELPLIKLDDHWLSRALYELLENAIYHSPDGGTVQITVDDDQGWVAITIADEGPGISQEHLPHLFTRFYKTDEARTDVERPGIGLTIAKHVVDEHGGTITVESDIGKGSTWVVKLPVADIVD